MSDTPPTVEEAQAEVEHAEADLSAAEFAAAEEPKSTEELLANAPPLILPEGTTLLKACHECGLRLDNPPPNLVCPNCGTVIP